MPRTHQSSKYKTFQGFSYKLVTLHHKCGKKEESMENEILNKVLSKLGKLQENVNVIKKQIEDIPLIKRVVLEM